MPNESLLIHANFTKVHMAKVSDIYKLWSITREVLFGSNIDIFKSILESIVHEKRNPYAHFTKSMHLNFFKSSISEKQL